MFSSERERLEKEGWERRFITDTSRVGELEELYSGMGFEVMVVHCESSGNDGCDACIMGDPDALRVIYTRKKTDEHEGENEREGE